MTERETETRMKDKRSVRIGDALADLAQRAGLTNDDIAAIEHQRDTVAAEPMPFA